VLRSGAHALLAQAVEAEVASFLAATAHLQTEDGRQRLVRHGHLSDTSVNRSECDGHVLLTWPKDWRFGGAFLTGIKNITPSLEKWRLEHAGLQLASVR
jgi:hypothetical protein